ncbi:hypothetical protein [Streptomyces sp. NPDC101150]|uniref:hypothetical protein n=1 Tax=Streptomyces sp. NPDC101150 TaxID=3366114 RepID=UPI003822C761
MGIESDQLVFDYLSRVGDLAQQRGLPAATRMRLVSGLRAEIDAQKADTVPGVKRMLSRLGTPEAVVTAAGSGETARPTATPPGPAWRGALTGKLPAPRDGAGPALPAFLRKGARRAAPEPEPEPTAAPPHLAGVDELGDGDDPPDWWRVDPSPYGPEETVHGFVGGIELPEIWDRPKGKTDKTDATDNPGAPRDGGGGPPPLEKAADGQERGDGKRPLPRLLRRALGLRPAPEAEAEPAAEDPEEAPPETAPASPWAWLSPLPTLAVVLLLAGAVLGSWLALGGGWALAYVSRRLTRREAKCAALWVPGAAVGALMVWLWGRFDGRWGEPLAPGLLGQALLDALPGVARVAAVGSAGFLLWRLRRGR